MSKPPVCYYYITHIDNLASIVKMGICARAIVEKEQLAAQSIHDIGIVERRRTINTPNNKALDQYANVYIQPRNPMLYRLICNMDINTIAILQISPSIVNEAGVMLTDGNAAHTDTSIQSYSKQALTMLNEKALQSEYWNDKIDIKRAIMAELLVPDRINAEQIIGIYVADETARQTVAAITGDQLPISVEKHMFFQPQQIYALNEKISLVQGDMFFSRAQTFTISVNTVGVMGKGLASRTKYQFPDAYVAYQDACRTKQLKMGRPFLYKRAARIEEELADDTSALDKSQLNGSRWFLFFATKQHWREKSDAAGITQGLSWLVDNYARLGIESIALPALGCGLGKLSWADVGPIMCEHLNKMTIRSRIYLPMEKSFTQEHLTKDYLLSAGA